MTLLEEVAVGLAQPLERHDDFRAVGLAEADLAAVAGDELRLDLELTRRIIPGSGGRERSGRKEGNAQCQKPRELPGKAGPCVSHDEPFHFFGRMSGGLLTAEASSGKVPGGLR